MLRLVITNIGDGESSQTREEDLQYTMCAECYMSSVWGGLLSTTDTYGPPWHRRCSDDIASTRAQYSLAFTAMAFRSEILDPSTRLNGTRMLNISILLNEVTVINGHSALIIVCYTFGLLFLIRNLWNQAQQQKCIVQFLKISWLTFKKM